MEVKTNPVRRLYRVQRTNWWEDATFGISLYHLLPAPKNSPNDPADWVDSEYAYERIDYPYVPGGTSLGGDYRLRAPTISSCGNLAAPNLILAPSLDASPKLLGQTTVWQNAGVGNQTMRSNVIDTILSVSPRAEPRTYPQTYNMGALGSCVIPPGEATCTITTNYVMGDASAAMERFSISPRLVSEDGTKSSTYLTTNFMFDLRPPVVESATVSDDGHAVALVMSEYATNGWTGSIKLTSAYLEAEDASGTVRRINATGLESTDGVLMWKADVSLSTLPSGIYTLRFYAVDAFGNTSAPKELVGHRRDVAGPLATLYTTEGEPLSGARLSSLSQVRFTVADDLDPAPTVTRVRLRGGPINDDINLGFHKQGNEYRVEFPRMLPSLDTGDYMLSVTARDSANNLDTTSVTFDYGPEHFGLAPEVGSAIAIPLVGVPTRRSDGLWPLTSAPAKLADAGGLPLTGRVDLTLTLSADARGPLAVGPLTLQPGTSATYPAYDFTANQSVLTLPVHIPAPEGVPPGRFGSLVVQIERPGAPVFVEDIAAWAPGESIVLTQRRPSFARYVETAAFQLRDGGDDRCPTLVALAAEEVYRNIRHPEDAAICAVRWLELPGDLTTMPTDPSRAGGIIASDEDTVTLRYQPGLLVNRAGGFAFFPSGEPVAHPVHLYDPEPPVLSLGVASERARQTDWLPDGKFPTDIGTLVSGYANARADYKGLHMSITDVASGAVVLDQSYSANIARGEIKTDIPAIEGEQTFRVDLRYLNHPRVASSATMTFVALPQSPLIQLIRPTNPNNIASTVLEGRFGLATRTEFSYDPASLGRWDIRIFKRDSATARTQLGQATAAIGPDGAFSVDLGTLPSGTYAILAEATYRGTSPDVNATVQSLPSTIKVFDGSPVTFALAASRDSGRPPMTGTVKIALSEPKRVGDVESIRWERSADGVTFEEIALEERYKRSFGYGERLLAPGEYWYRATTVNRFSGAAHTADPIKVHIYDVPAFTLSGHTQTFSGTPVEWSAVTENTGRPVLYRWSVRRGSYKDAEPLLLDGATQRLAADVNGSWYIAVESRFADAPDVPSAWRKVSGLLKVATPAMSRPRIVGPYTVETDKTYRYNASAYVPIRTANGPSITVEGFWTLPDGSVRNGAALDYTVRPGDQQLAYTAWLNGYRAETEQTTTLNLRPWEYRFPEFRMYKRLVREHDPAQYSYSIVQVTGATSTGGETPSYEWDFPPGAQVDQRSNTTAIVSASAPGLYPIRVRAFDTRGNDAELADAFEVNEPPPLTASLKLLVGDAWNRAPAKLTARWYVGGLLGKESVNAIGVRLNGVPVSERMLSAYSFDVAEIGTHVVELDVRTTYGRTARYSTNVELVKGELPSCTVSAAITSSLRAQAVCSVPMGRLVGYRWSVTYTDGETRDLGLRSSAILFGSAEIDRGIRNITMIAVNDKGQQSPPAIWTP
jgi:hypothetical protein